MKKILFATLVLLLTGCATEPTQQVYAPQLVTGWVDAEGHIHLKGVGGRDGHAVIKGERRPTAPLGWGGASK